MDLHDTIAPWVRPVIGDEPLSPAEIEKRALTLIDQVDGALASELRLALGVSKWVLPLLALRVRRPASLSLRRRELALSRAVDPPLILRPLADPLNGIARALKLVIVFCTYTDHEVRRSIGYRPMLERPRAAHLDLRPTTYPTPEGARR